MILETVSVGPMQVNCYIIAAKANAKAILIDPGEEEAKIRGALKRHGLDPAFIVNTHGHWDHIGCDERFGVPVYIHGEDAPLLKDPERNLSSFFDVPFRMKSEVKVLADGETVALDDLKLQVIHLPGHTPGGIALFLKSPQGCVLFSGDSLFRHSVGRSDFPGADGRLLIESIRARLLTLPDDTAVYPGHGPASTIGEEKSRNPFLS